MSSVFAKLTGSEFDAMADIYAEAGVQEYWVVDIPSSRIHVLSKSDGKSYRKIETAVAPQFLTPTCLPSAKLDLTDLFWVT